MGQHVQYVVSKYAEFNSLTNLYLLYGNVTIHCVKKIDINRFMSKNTVNSPT